ncbi:DUF1989 domain-containing protein [Granulosicoccaceae sp. 1_MG-2023]|nr:DUF1989 domain-containing protein [Granulosicoccaceae sp. 1_MG-2023]
MPDSILKETAAGSERLYRLGGQQMMRLHVQRGDSLTLQSEDGIQGAALYLRSEGVHGNVLAGLSAVACTGLPGLAEEDSGAGTRLRTQLQDWAVSTAMLAEFADVPAAEVCSFSCDVAGELFIATAAPTQGVWQQSPATAVRIRHRRVPDAAEDLPEPLAAVINEVRVPDSSARAYEVRAGQWIQIIDVAGKQCSDFTAFDLQALKEGREVVLDATATRTLTGQNLPGPGLYSRFFDSAMRPMLEVVQDTVGRHDSFLFACTPKYYEDAGYFGHPNCTDNFNRELAAYGIAPRAGWPAINFFFNTMVGDCGTIGMDEPWSRPGDYVLMRATRDLLCVSSACPDDIDAANGWCPTDIHVRIYDAAESFPRALAWRLTPEEPPRMTQETAFHPRTSALSAEFSEYRGYWVADQYRDYGELAEYYACRERVAMIDLSPLRKFEVLGPDAETLLQYALTRNVRKLAVGAITYSAMCLDTGGMIDDGTLFRMSEQGFRWICGDPYSGQWLRELAEKHSWQVQIRDASEQIHNLAVQGPQSRKLLAGLLWTPPKEADVSELGLFRFSRARLGGPDGPALMVSRTGYTGELGFEVWCHPDHALTLWDAISEAGQPLGLAPMGFAALDRLRIEAGLIFAEHEFCPETNPFEAGIGFTVPLKSKTDDFCGREAIERQSPASRHKLVGLILDSQERAEHGDSVFNGRFPVGVVTSATFSPVLGKSIALCRVAPDYSKPGTRLEVGKLDGHQKRLAADVCTLPFYDPERLRLRS